jgi:hypothetical protein
MVTIISNCLYEVWKRFGKDTLGKVYEDSYKLNQQRIASKKLNIRQIEYLE